MGGWEVGEPRQRRGEQPVQGHGETQIQAIRSRPLGILLPLLSIQRNNKNPSQAGTYTELKRQSPSLADDSWRRERWGLGTRPEMDPPGPTRWYHLQE